MKAERDPTGGGWVENSLALFSRKPPALTSINHRKSATNPEIASVNPFGSRWAQLSQTQFDKITTRETIYKHIREFPIKVHRGRGQDFPIFISRRYLVELGPRQLGLPVADFSVRFK